MFTPSKKPFFFLLALLAVVFGLFTPYVSTLPKEKAGDLESKLSSPSITAPARPTPVLYDPEAELAPGGYPAPTPTTSTSYRHIGPQPLVSSGVPYVFIRQGIPETGQTNNHMRDKVWVSANGTVHMVYPIRNSDALTPIY